MAIVGAGLAGLACAHELERLGVLPVVFEQQPRVGKSELLIETMPQFLHFEPRPDLFDYLRGELHLPLQPHGVVQTILLHGPREEAMLTGELAYTTLRGPDDRSLERQLAAHLATPIRYRDAPDLWELRRQFDWVVAATGDHEWTRGLTSWAPDGEWVVRAVRVTGQFNPSWQELFVNPRYAGAGYGLITPFDDRTALVSIAVPDTSESEVERCWQTFLAENRSGWERESPPVMAQRFSTGLVKPCVIGNLMLVGQAGGFSEPLGMTGQCPSLSSGVHAARQIVLGDRSLERFARQFRSYYSRLLGIRHRVNAWTADEADQLVRAARYGGSLRPLSPFSLLTPAGVVLDALRLAGDGCLESGKR